MKRLSSIRSLEKELMALAREYVDLRDKSTCQKCGRVVDGKSKQLSHVIPKSRSYLLRFDANNLKILCGGCHREWHDNPLESRWFDLKFPERRAYLKRRQYTIFRIWALQNGTIKREWLNKQIADYKEKINEARKKKTS